MDSKKYDKDVMMLDIKQKKILVIGDVMLDIYITGKVERISPEAPVPVFNELSIRHVLGGAANVALNLVAANQDVSLATVIGNDEISEKILFEIKNNKIDSSCVIKSNSRKSTSKTRYLAQNHQQLIRVDVEEGTALNENETEELLVLIKSKIKNFDLLIFSDYCKGVLTENVMQAIIREANAYGIKCIADVKDPNYTKYKNIYLIKPNLLELRSLTKLSVNTEDEIIIASQTLLCKVNCDYILVTCGENGMYFVKKDGFKHIKGTAKEVYDVTGAGDTVIAYLGVGIANELSLKQSIRMANIAAGIKVSKIGTSAVYLEEVKKEYHTDTMNKVISIESISLLKKSLIGKRIVFTNGCFDILHAGHVTYLEKAKKLGDVLIVGLNSDASIKRLKGDQRPIHSVDDRIKVLSALYVIDYIIVFSEDTPYNIIEVIKPDVLVKGSDYRKDEVVGCDILQSYGGSIVLIDYVEGKSTTKILEMTGEERYGAEKTYYQHN